MISSYSIIINNKCNLDCSYCMIEHKDESEMETKVINKAIDYIFSGEHNSPVKISFFGVEPLLSYKKIKHWIKYTEKKYPDANVKYGITTNLTVLNSKWIDLILDNNIYILASYDGFDVHDKFRKLKHNGGTRDIVEYNMRRLEENGIKYMVAMSVPHNAIKGLADRVIKLFTDFKPEAVALNKVVDHYITYTHKEFKTLENELNILADRLIEEFKNNNYNWKVTNFVKTLKAFHKYPRRSERNNWTCGAAKKSITIGIDGTIYPCHRFAYIPDSEIGTIYIGTNNDRIRIIRSFDFGKCQNCYVYPCAGCWVINYLTNYNLFKIPEAYCKFEKARFKSSLYLYTRLAEEGLLEKVMNKWVI